MDRVSRVCAVAFVMVGGLVHLDLWRSGYRGIPSIGRLFIANVVVSAVLAVAVLVRRDTPIIVAGLLFSGGSLAALVLSRTVGILGFTERAWTDRAIQASTAELGAIVAFAALIVASRSGLQQVVPSQVRVHRQRRA